MIRIKLIARPWRPAALLLLLLSSALISPAALAQFEVHGGVSVTTGGEATSVVAAAWVPEWRRFENATLRAEVGAMYFDGRHVRGDRDLNEGVTVGYLGARLEFDRGWLLGFGVGGQSGHSDALSGSPQFVSSAGWRHDRFSLIVRHVSNARLHEPNGGETMLLAGWRF